MSSEKAIWSDIHDAGIGAGGTLEGAFFFSPGRLVGFPQLPGHELKWSSALRGSGGGWA